jgi:hypothetical protein
MQSSTSTETLHFAKFRATAIAIRKEATLSLAFGGAAR